MRTLNVVKVLKDDVIINWSIKKYSLLPSGELFIRCNRKGDINWARAPLYSWNEIQREQARRRVCFLIPSDNNLAYSNDQSLAG